MRGKFLTQVRNKREEKGNMWLIFTLEGMLGLTVIHVFLNDLTSEERDKQSWSQPPQNNGWQGVKNDYNATFSEKSWATKSSGPVKKLREMPLFSLNWLLAVTGSYARPSLWSDFVRQLSWVLWPPLQTLSRASFHSSNVVGQHQPLHNTKSVSNYTSAGSLYGQTFPSFFKFLFYTSTYKEYRNPTHIQRL